MTLVNEIYNFLLSKNFSKNTQANYLYDLRKFVAFFVDKNLSDETLKLYQHELSSLSITAQRRKMSSANQYLAYLYDKKLLNHFYKMKIAKLPTTLQPKQKSELPTYDFTEFYKPVNSPGHFLALLILEFGLTFVEIQQLKWEDFNWDFKYLTVNRAGMKRVVPIRERFALRVRRISNANELFCKSRQFMYLELKKYTKFTAKELREQYIIQQVHNGKSIYEVAALLGLSTISTLEKYYR